MRDGGGGLVVLWEKKGSILEVGTVGRGGLEGRAENFIWKGTEAFCRLGIDSLSLKRYFCKALAIRICSCSSLHSFSDGEGDGEGKLASCCATDV